MANALARLVKVAGLVLEGWGVLMLKMLVMTSPTGEG